MPKPMNVLHLAAADCEWEAAVNIASLAAGLREHSIQSSITAPDHSRLWELAEAAGVPVIHLEISKTANPLRWLDIGRVVKEGGFDLIHAHDPAASALVSRSAMVSSLPCRVTSRYDMRQKITSSEYGSGVAAVICPSQALAGQFAQADAGGKTSVIFDGVNLAAADMAVEERQVLRTRLRDEYCPDKEKPLIIINVAPLETASNQAAIMEAVGEIAASLPQTHLFIMGEGSLADDLVRQRKTTALERDVTFLEPDKAYFRILAAADLFVAADAMDISGYMVQAAMAANLATVITPTGCYPELVEHDKSGIHAESASAESLKTAMLDLLENRNRRHHLGRMARARAAKLFNNSVQCGTVAEVYRGCVSATTVSS